MTLDVAWRKNNKQIVWMFSSWNLSNKNKEADDLMAIDQIMRVTEVSWMPTAELFCSCTSLPVFCWLLVSYCMCLTWIQGCLQLGQMTPVPREVACKVHVVYTCNNKLTTWLHTWKHPPGRRVWAGSSHRGLSLQFHPVWSQSALSVGLYINIYMGGT